MHGKPAARAGGVEKRKQKIKAEIPVTDPVPSPSHRINNQPDGDEEIILEVGIRSAGRARVNSSHGVCSEGRPCNTEKARGHYVGATAGRRDKRLGIQFREL